MGRRVDAPGHSRRDDQAAIRKVFGQSLSAVDTIGGRPSRPDDGHLRPDDLRHAAANVQHERWVIYLPKQRWIGVVQDVDDLNLRFDSPLPFGLGSLGGLAGQEIVDDVVGNRTTDAVGLDRLLPQTPAVRSATSVS